MLGIVHVPYWWHASLLEVLWLAAGLLALPITHANLTDAQKDENILDEVRRDPTIHSRHYFMIAEAAKGRTLDHWLTLVASLLITVAGIIGCASPNPLRGATTATGFVVTACLVGIAMTSAVRAYAALLRRQRISELAAGRSRVLAAEMRSRSIPPPEGDQE